MKLLVETWKNSGKLHHGYALAGERQKLFDELCAFLAAELTLSMHGNPDFWHEDFETFGIDDGRKIKELHIVRPLGERRVFVIKTNFMTREAQNSLLKILEEPGEGNHFFLIIPHDGILLPTLRSRLQIVRDEGESKSLKMAKEFVRGSVGLRLELVKEMMGEIEDETKTRQDVVALVCAIEEELVKVKMGKMTKADALLLEELEKCRDYLGDRAPSTKMILEHIAVSL